MRLAIIALSATMFMAGCATTHGAATYGGYNNSGFQHPSAVAMDQMCANRTDICRSMTNAARPMSGSGPFMPR